MAPPASPMGQKKTWKFEANPKWLFGGPTNPNPADWASQQLTELSAEQEKDPHMHAEFLLGTPLTIWYSWNFAKLSTLSPQTQLDWRLYENH